MTKGQTMTLDGGHVGESWRLAMRQIVGDFYGPLMNYFGRRVASQGEAENLTQEVFLRMAASSNVKPIGNIEAILFTLATELLEEIEQSSQTFRRSTNCDSWKQGENQQACESNAAWLGTKGRLKGMIYALSKKMSASTRNIFILYRLEHMSVQDIADLYGLSRSAVKRHITRALALTARCE